MLVWHEYSSKKATLPQDRLPAPASILPPRTDPDTQRSRPFGARHRGPLASPLQAVAEPPEVAASPWRKRGRYRAMSLKGKKIIA